MVVGSIQTRISSVTQVAICPQPCNERVTGAHRPSAILPAFFAFRPRMLLAAGASRE